MSTEELRDEEDYFKSLGLTICDGCEKGKGNDCTRCAYHYQSLYTKHRVITKIREAIAEKEQR